VAAAAAAREAATRAKRGRAVDILNISIFFFSLSLSFFLFSFYIPELATMTHYNGSVTLLNASVYAALHARRPCLIT